MTAYIIRRILFMIPTMFGIMLVAFVVVQFAPGGPVEQVIAKLTGADTGATVAHFRVGQAATSAAAAWRKAPRRSTRRPRSTAVRRDSIRSSSRNWKSSSASTSRRYERFALMLWNYIRFDFGKSYFRDVSVLQLIKEKLPVSMSLGIWMTLLTYLISIPLGIRKAVDDGSRFDVWTSSVIIIGYAIPGFLFRDPADHLVRRRLVLRLVSAARAGVGELVGSCRGGKRSSTISGI